VTVTGGHLDRIVAVRLADGVEFLALEVPEDRVVPVSLAALPDTYPDEPIAALPLSVVPALVVHGLVQPLWFDVDAAIAEILEVG
jgi:hypothetical protein